MTLVPTQCEDLATQVNQILELLNKNQNLRAHQETTQLQILTLTKLINL